MINRRLSAVKALEMLRNINDHDSDDGSLSANDYSEDEIGHSVGCLESASSDDELDVLIDSLIEQHIDETIDYVLNQAFVECDEDIHARLNQNTFATGFHILEKMKKGTQTICLASLSSNA